ncbi:MAG: hypothetical protein ABIH26_04435 [Candidatus Eisenbacteria bacterium]
MKAVSKRSSESVKEGLAVLAGILYVVAAFAAFALMVAIFFMGFRESGRGILIYFGRAPADLHGMTPESKALQMCLKGLEFFFLAPLAFLILQSLAKYIVSILRNQTDQESTGSDGDERGASPDRRLAEREEHAAKCKVIGVKALVVGLMIATLATDLVGRALSREGLTYEIALSQAAVIAVLMAYVFLLERLAISAVRSGD